MGEHKKQHYVQQSYLRRFSTNQKQIHVFDKKLNRAFASGISAVAQESHFYRLPDGLVDEDGVPVNLDPLTVEKWFQTIEGDFNIDIQSLIDLAVHEPIPAELRLSLSRSIAIQYLRTRAARNMIVDMAVQLARKITNDAITLNFGEEALEYAPKIDYSDQAAGLIQIGQILDENRIDELAGILNGHVWQILNNPTGQPFYTSDNPVALHNHFDRPKFRPGRGLASPRIEIAFPLSSQKLLSICDRGTFNGAVIDGGAADIKSENVEFYNSLQVLDSERQIYCEGSDWFLVEDMIKESPRLTEKQSRVSVD